MLALAAVLLAAPPVTLDGYFPFTPPTERAAWERRAADLRVQVQVAAGLYPMPPRPPVTATVHGLIDRGDYTVEKVFFPSLPGHTVCGNLYRPKGATGRRPAVLCPHGHWKNGRLDDAGDAKAKADVASGGEDTTESARFPLQALPAGLARLGCVAFAYDMLGYADSTSVGHRTSFLDAASALHGHSEFGLQTWNSLRAFDFLAGRPDVDPTRIGCTGGSGGGTQTFVLAAIEPRVAAAFPAVMVSTAMQGGCVCENAPHLRVGTGNVELAALIAPRPLGMTAADDWTKQLEAKGLPELKRLYTLFGVPGNVEAHAFLRFPHNYNQRSREAAYGFFAKHFKLPRPTSERPFVPVPPDELRVFDAAHPRPADELPAERLHLAMVERDKAVPVGRDELKAALRVLLHTDLPLPVVETVTWESKTPNGTTVVWLHPRGLERTADAQAFLDAGFTLVAFAAPPAVAVPKYVGFTAGYNRTPIADDACAALATVKVAKGRVALAAWGDRGAAGALAACAAGDGLAAAACDLAGFRFDRVTKLDDPRLLPGVERYGGLPGLLPLAVGRRLIHAGEGVPEVTRWLTVP